MVASLWPVADTSTQALMQHFYRLRESQAGLPKVEALRQAQLALLHGQEEKAPGPQVAALGVPPVAGEAVAMATTLGDLRGEPERQGQDSCGNETVHRRFRPSAQAPYTHPYYWAPFILIGNWK